MALKDTVRIMKNLLDTIQKDIAKAETGNKAASQRVRTLSIKLEKTAKLYRKESIKAEKSGSVRKVSKAKKPIKTAAKKTKAHKTPSRFAKKPTPAKKSTCKTSSSSKCSGKPVAKRCAPKSSRSGKSKKK